MSNYIQSTNFATKDALTSGDPLKIVKGTEINIEYANIAVAVATKADLVSATLVTPALGTPSSGNLLNAVGLPIDAGTTGTLPISRGGSGVQTSTGTGNLVLSNNPTFVSPTLGTPATGVMTNVTGLSLITGVVNTLPVANGGTGVTSSTGTGNTVLSNSPTFTGSVTGTFLGNITGNVSGNVSGNVTGNVIGNVTGNVTGTAANITGIAAVANGGTGTATPSIVAGSNITLSGTFPNQTINAILQGVNGAFRSMQVFTASGTYTKPTGLVRIKVTVIGGGGGGGHNGAGGGGGGAAIKVIETASIGTTETVTIGVGGASGNLTTTTGGTGGTSSIGTLCSATGGTGGGYLYNTNGGTGGIGIGGSLNIGGSGGSARAYTTNVGGIGGSSFMGGGGLVPRGGDGQNGGAGRSFGGGGSGGAPNDDPAGNPGNGGVGFAGVIFFEEFF